MYRYLSIWELHKGAGRSNTIPRERLLHILEAITPNIAGEDTLSFLQRTGIVEVIHRDGFRLSAFGVGLRKLMSDEADGLEEEVVQTPGQWDNFRKLVAYYQDCISADGRRQACFCSNDFGKRFIIPVLACDWLVELGAVAPSVVHTFSRAESPFQYAVTNLAHQDMELCLGYPLGVLRRKDGSVNYLPVAIIPAKIVKCSPTVPEFRLQYDESEVNPLWLKELVSEEQQKPLQKKLHETGTGEYQGLLDVKKMLPLLESWMHLPEHTFD